MKSWLACLFLSILVALPAAAELELNPEDISWSTENGIVTFQMRFRNTGTEPTEAFTGDIQAQAFGAFAENLMPIDGFDIPPIPPDSFFDVFTGIPYELLPPSAEEILPWAKAAKDGYCPPDWHWDGNVDVNWFGPGGVGGGSTQAHYGTLQVCPGYGGSYIHVVTGCFTGGTTWNINSACTWLTINLENEDHTLAPAVLPMGWTGWIAVDALLGTPVGSSCCFTVNFTCGGVTVPVKLCVTACDCGPIGTQRSSWGEIKALFK